MCGDFLKFFQKGTGAVSGDHPFICFLNDLLESPKRESVESAAGLCQIQSKVDNWVYGFAVLPGRISHTSRYFVFTPTLSSFFFNQIPSVPILPA